MSRRRFLGVLCLSLVLMAATGTASGMEDAGPRPVTDRPQAPDFTLKGLDGGSHTLSDLRGKVVLVNFWASWCPPCREEMPSMQRLYAELAGRDFEVLAVNVGEREETVFSFTRGEIAAELEFPILLDPAAEVIERYPAPGLPATFVVDRQGRLALKAVGGREMDSAKFKRPILELLAGE